MCWKSKGTELLIIIKYFLLKIQTWTTKAALEPSLLRFLEKQVHSCFKAKGSRGGITQVKVDLIGQKRSLIRNVMGPVKKGDTLELMESEREARRLRWVFDFI